MANRIILNNISYHGKGAINEIVGIANDAFAFSQNGISFIFISFVFRGKFHSVWKCPFKWFCMSGQFLNPSVSIQGPLYFSFSFSTHLTFFVTKNTL